MNCAGRRGKRRQRFVKYVRLEAEVLCCFPFRPVRHLPVPRVLFLELQSESGKQGADEDLGL